jgi:GntR family transcriptional regulator, rspAB operon transcriptional repressor
MRSSLRSTASAEGRPRSAPERPGGRSELPSGYLVEEAYRYLKTRIMSADLPPGASLNELDIAAALGTSRTPVREAIRKLEQEGLAMRYPNRGAIVTKLSMTDVLEIWQLREILEPAACRLAADRIDREALDRIELGFLDLRGHEVGPEAYEAFLRADMGLHGLIVDSTGNATLRHVLEMLNERIVQIRVVTSPARFRHAVDEHLAIIAALKARHAQEAMEAMRRHLENARQSLVRLT